jgi:putative permease
MNHVFRYTVVVLLTLGAFIVLWEFREAIILFLVSLALGAVFRPMVAALEKRRVPRVPAILLSYFLVIGGFIGLIYLVSQPLGKELQHATDNFAVQYTRIRREWVEGNSFQQTVAAQLPPLEALYRAIAGQQGETLVRGLAGAASNIVGFFSALAIVIALSMYWSADRVYFERLWLSFLPSGQRTRAREIWREIENGVGAYIRSEFIQAVMAGLLLALAYSLLGLRYPIMLALLGALAWLIPWVGAVLAVVPAFLVGAGDGLWLAAAAALVTLAILIALEVLVERRLFDRRPYSSVLLVLVAIIMANALGIIGILIAPPLAAALQIAASRIFYTPSRRVHIKPEERIARARSRLENLRLALLEIDSPPVHLSSLIQRLERLIDATEEAV